MSILIFRRKLLDESQEIRVNIVQRRELGSWVIDDSVRGIPTHRDVSWGLSPAAAAFCHRVLVQIRFFEQK